MIKNISKPPVIAISWFYFKRLDLVLFLKCFDVESIILGIGLDDFKVDKVKEMCQKRGFKDKMKGMFTRTY